MITDLEAWRLPVFLSGLFVFFFIEMIVPNRMKMEKSGDSMTGSLKIRRWLTHGFLAISNSVIIKVAFFPAYLAVASELYQLKWGILHILKLPIVPEVILSIILLDLLDYAWHRANHQSGFLWRFHKVHHHDVHMDVTTSLRFHLGELVLSLIAKLLWILILGPSPEAFILFEILISLASQFHHADWELPLLIERTFSPWIVTPQYHTSHHTLTSRTRQANFSTIFAFWDKLFRSREPIDLSELNVLGLEGQREKYLDPPTILMGPFSKKY